MDTSQWLPIAEIAGKVQKGELKAAGLVEQSLKAINEKKEYDAIIATTETRACERARNIDDRAAKGEKIGRLAGVPFIAKDNFLVFGAETTAASNILRGFEAPYQATAIEKLEAEGAICVAKANLDAFAHGTSTENSDFFTTRNPHDKTRVPGGSSGGSAASVVLGMAPFAIGTDTGGSIRQPASFSGCVGYKPTYGLVSRNGVVAMGSSLDVIGPLTRTVADTALVLDVIADRDDLDSTTIERDPKGYSLSRRPKLDLGSSQKGIAEGDSKSTGFPIGVGNDEIKGKKVGVIKEHMGEGLDPEILAKINDTVKTLETAGAEITEINLPSLPMALAVYYILCPAEVSSNLGRYDGQRFGYSYKDAKDMDESYSGSRGRGFGKEAKRRIMIGTYVLSSGYYDAYYKQAQTVRTKLIDEFDKAFEQVDFLVGPVAPTTAFKIGENVNDPLRMYMSDIMTVGVNLAGNAAISLPAGMIDGLPVGVQLIAPQRADRELLAFSRQAEALLV